MTKEPEIIEPQTESQKQVKPLLTSSLGDVFSEQAETARYFREEASAELDLLNNILKEIKKTNKLLRELVKNGKT